MKTINKRVNRVTAGPYWAMSLILYCGGLSAIMAQPQPDEQPGKLPVVAVNISESEQIAMLTAVCDATPRRDDEDFLGCQRCPDYTSGDGLEGGFRLNTLHQGRFTGLGEPQQILLDMEGCEPHSNEFGGSVLLGQESSTWQRIAYFPAFRSDDCLHFYYPNHPDRLVCNESESAQGIIVGEVVALWIRKNHLQQQSLLSWFDNQGMEENKVISILPVDWQQQDRNGDQIKDLAITVKVQQFLLSDDDASSSEPSIDTLHYIFRNDHFELTPDSQPIKQKLEQLVSSAQQG